jgi:hypothetical protein
LGDRDLLHGQPALVFCSEHFIENFLLAVGHAHVGCSSFVTITFGRLSDGKITVDYAGCKDAKAVAAGGLGVSEGVAIPAGGCCRIASVDRSQDMVMLAHERVCGRARNPG